MLAASIFFLFLAQNVDDTFDWHDNYADALKEAKATGKPIFLEYRCEP